MLCIYANYKICVIYKHHLSLIHEHNFKIFDQPGQRRREVTGADSKMPIRSCHGLVISYIYMLPCSVLTSPPWYGPPRPWPRAHRPTIWLCKAACLPSLPLFPHLVKFPANTVQINTSCKDYDSINQHSHQSPRTTCPQGGRGANHDHAQGGKGEERRWSIYIYMSLSNLVTTLPSPAYS